MNAQEKAAELIYAFECSDIYDSKSLAIRCVDEILKVIDFNYDYWMKVKEEIQNF